METGNILAGFRAIEKDIAENWRADDYPPNMRSGIAQFRHAFAHTVKAMGKIATRIDHIEHNGEPCDEVLATLSEMPKVFADMIRCTVKMAQMVDVNIGGAYVDRAEQLAARWAQPTPRRETDGDTRAVADERESAALENRAARAYASPR